LSEVAERAAAGETVALTLMAETGALLGRVLSSLVSALNPSRIVIGGHLATVAPWMLPALRDELARTTLEHLAAGLAIDLSPLGADATLMGGVALALQKADDELIDAVASVGG
jgi:predicted NBD/HSP70 family sugar kinase